jgi:hypothetical protein
MGFALVIAVSAAASAADATVPPALLAAIRHHQVDETIKESDFRVALFDLDGDGRADAIVLFSGEWCGSGGCTMEIYRAAGDGFSFLARSTIVQPPVKVLESKSHGWVDLSVATGGVGAVILRFNGKRYPSNPSLQPRASAEQLRTAKLVLDR